MIRLLGLVISIGIADSLNPTTIAPALYLASGRHPRRQVAEFTLAVFAVVQVAFPQVIRPHLLPPGLGRG